jgi:hypothetical protein
MRSDANSVSWLAGPPSHELEDLQRTTAMTIEFLHLTAQIQHWVNVRVARHLAAQAARLARKA